MEVTAKLLNARISPQKCRLVADMVRGQPVGRALATLRFTPKKGAEIVRSMEQISAATGSLVTSSDEMKATVGALTAAAGKLHDELQKFNL